MSDVAYWIMSIESPSLEQTGIFYAIVGIAGMIIKFYMTSGRAWGPQLEWKDSGNNKFLSNQKDEYYIRNKQRSNREEEID